MSKKKKILLSIISVFLAFILVIVGYLLYVIIAYKRIPDNQILDVYNTRNTSTLKVGESQTILSWNTGFAAYSQDYSFFMDGGKYSRAYNKQEVIKNVNSMIDVINNANANIVLLQEVDVKATRSYKINQADMYTTAINKSHNFAYNYDSPYLFWPLIKPHGKSQAGLLTLTDYQMQNATRYQLPIENGFTKFLDLDRCYTKTLINVNNNKKLCLYNIHLSAYTTDGTIADEQIKILVKDMQQEYDNGNYIICGGDFNKDLLGNSGDIFGVSGENYTWAKPFPTNLLGNDLKLISGYDENNKVASCRNTDMPYEKGKTFEVTLDGFIISNNITSANYAVINQEFKNSDHNPVIMNFILN